MAEVIPYSLTYRVKRILRLVTKHVPRAINNDYIKMLSHLLVLSCDSDLCKILPCTTPLLVLVIIKFQDNELSIIFSLIRTCVSYYIIFFDDATDLTKEAL